MSEEGPVFAHRAPVPEQAPRLLMTNIGDGRFTLVHDDDHSLFHTILGDVLRVEVLEVRRA